MNSIRRFRIERKNFEVVFNKDFVGITERSKAGLVSAQVEADLARWLRSKLKGLVWADEVEPRVGVLGSRRGKEMDIVINVKRNKAGFYISILCLNSKLSRGFTCIRIPQGKNCQGWILFQKALDWVLSENPRKGEVQIRRKEVQKVIAEIVPHETVYELRSEWVVVTTHNDYDDWDALCKEVQSRIELCYCPEATVITNRRALLNVRGSVDRDKIINLVDFCMEDCRVSFSIWTPGIDTLSSSWFQKKQRWLTLVGIPYHLYSEETVKSLICRFGVVKRFSSVGTVVGGLSGPRVLIDNCDVRLIPHFLPLVDLGGVVYPIRLLLDLNEMPAEDNSMGGSVRSRSYADVVAGKYNHQRTATQWRRREAHSRNIQQVSRGMVSPEVSMGDNSRALKIADTDVNRIPNDESSNDLNRVAQDSQQVDHGQALDLNKVPEPSNSGGSSNIRIESPHNHEESQPGSDTECIAALNHFEEQSDWEVASDDEEVGSDDGTVLVENSQVPERDEVDGLNTQEENHVITSELHVLGKLFQMEGLEDKRCTAVLERVNLNFGANGKSAKKRRVEVTAVELGDNGEDCFINGD